MKYRNKHWENCNRISTNVPHKKVEKETKLASVRERKGGGTKGKREWLVVHPSRELN